MPPSPARKASYRDSSADLGFEANFWLTAEKSHNKRTAWQYTHVIIDIGLSASVANSD
jgi:predicted AAA+ superfamily ATPase